MTTPLVGATSKGAGGIAAHGDVVYNRSSQKLDLTSMWAEVEQAVELFNGERQTLSSLLSFPTIASAEAVPQVLQALSFDIASEYGLPRASAVPPVFALQGFDFHDYDLRTGFTWKFLRDASAEQVRAQVTRIMEGDKKLTTGLVLNRLFDPTQSLNEFGNPCTSVWNGDGQVPPTFMGREFSGNHTHFLCSGAETIDSGDIDGMVDHVAEHGYGINQGSQLVILASRAEAEAISSWRAGVKNANDQTATYDFIPSESAVSWISAENIHGAIPPADYNGLKVQGSYGHAWLITSPLVPAGYVAVVATSGLESDENVIGVRHHPDPDWQGLRAVPGPFQRYPLQESVFARGIGVGVRHRGAAAVCQVTSSAEYTPPVIAI